MQQSAVREIGRITEVRSAGVVQAHYRYGSYGKTVTYTDGAGSEYCFEKDGYGLLTTEQDRLGNKRTYRYSKEDELAEAEQRNGAVRSVTRRKGAEITTYRDGSRYEIVKDITGQVIYEKGLDGHGKCTSEVRYRYDEAGLLIEQADEAGSTTITYRYNKAGYRTEMETNDRYVVYEIDGRGRVTEISDRKQYFKVQAFYDENDREVKRILGNGNTQQYTYDEAGRLLGIVETASNRAIIWAECYGYDGEGRRIFTADEKGNLTRYIYDEQYRIKEVQYPASEELKAYHLKEAKEARLFIDEGAASSRREIMNPVELARISANFSRLVGARTSKLGSMVSSIQQVWAEQYTYDANGNIETKTTPYGTIRYSYDKENRLLTRGAVHYTYDEEGNLLREEQSDYYLKRYQYAGFNRMEVSDVINYTDNTHVITEYRYDSFGRRTHTAERTKWGMRTIYDGLTFEAVKEGETTPDSRSITTTGTNGASINEYKLDGSHTRGTRYYFIRDRGKELRTDKNGEALPDRTKGVRTYLYLNGERVAVNNLYNTNHGQYYYGSDILGSVKFVTGQGGQELKRIEYDVFGSIYKGNSPYGLETGYTGKPYDAVTGLSDYGFRDYAPTHARFITEDPIRDGENWFAYVGNNPVNWVDPWGLSASDGKGGREYSLDGAYLGGTTTGINGIKVSTYIYKGSASAGKLDLGFLRNRDGSLLTQEDFDTIVAAVVGEASKKHNLEEAYAIADVIMNRANYTQETAAHIVKSSGIRGYNDESITRVSKNEMLNIDKGITNARAAVIDAFIGTVDSSNGAYFWDGNDIAITDRNDRLYNPHRDWGLFYTSSTHDIHHTGNILFPDIICYYELENGKQGGFRGKYNHIFDSTAAYGDTVFWKYNPDFMRAEGNKEYP